MTTIFTSTPSDALPALSLSHWSDGLALGALGNDCNDEVEHYFDFKTRHPGIAVPECPTGGDCFVAGTQILVRLEFTEDDIFVRYVTTNIEDIKIGDWV